MLFVVLLVIVLGAAPDDHGLHKIYIILRVLQDGQKNTKCVVLWGVCVLHVRLQGLAGSQTQKTYRDIQSKYVISCLLRSSNLYICVQIKC